MKPNLVHFQMLKHTRSTQHLYMGFRFTKMLQIILLSLVGHSLRYTIPFKSQFNAKTNRIMFNVSVFLLYEFENGWNILHFFFFYILIYSEHLVFVCKR